MASLAIDVASTAVRANVQARNGKSDQTSAGDDFGTMVDSNIAGASAATPTDAAPQRSQSSAPRSENSSGTGEKKDQPQQKTGVVSERPSEPAAAQTDATATADATIETPVVAVDTAVTIAVGIAPVEDAAPTADQSTETDASATADAAAPQPIVTGIVAPVAVVPAVAPAVAIEAAPAASVDPVTIDAITTASASSAAEVPVDATSAPAPASALAAAEQTTEPTTIVSAAIAAATKPKLAATTQADGEGKADTNNSSSASVETKVPANTELTPAVDLKSAAKPVTAENEKPSAKIETKTEAAAQSDSAAPVRDPRPAHSASAETRVDASAAAPASSTPTTQSLQHVTAPPTQVSTSAAVTPPPINASVQLASNIAVPMSGLAVNIAFNANAGRSRFEIRLDPAELGRIDVRLDVDRNGQVTSHLTVERPATLDMLRRDAPQLQRALEDAGLKTGDSGLQFSLRDQSQQQAGSEDRSSRGQPYRLVVDELPALPAEAGRTYARLAAARGGVDIRI